MRLRGTLLLLIGAFLLSPALAHAQATLAGVVRDNTGAVLPGVTVEATSLALIEKARTAVTDGTGQYRITELPPGTYTLIFTLSGFNVVRREDVEVRGSGVTPINVELRVGALSETITVTGESPLVDTQTTRRETVITSEVISTLPVTRSYGTLLAAIPGIVTDNTSRGAMTDPFMTFFTSNGGRGNEGRMLIDGMPVAASFNGGGVSTFIYDIANTQEVQVLVSGGLGEAEAGGPTMNLVPQSGGNSFRGQGFYSTAGNWSRSDNIDDRLRAANINRPPGLVKNFDGSATFGGPIKRDRLWFFGNFREVGQTTIVEGAYGNLNAGNLAQWGYAQDTSLETRNANRRDIYSLRLTGQVTQKNRVSFSHEYQHRCSGSTVTSEGEGCRSREGGWIGLGTTTAAPESWVGYHDFPYNVTQASWTNPLSNRILLEAGFSRFQYLWAGFGIAPPDGFKNVIPVTESQAIDGHVANFTYRGAFDPLGFGWADNDANPNNWKASFSYITGAHSAKIGYQGSYQRSLLGRRANTTLLRYTFNGRSPNGVGYTMVPNWTQNDRTATGSVFVQDQWTVGRFTLQGAVRYDRAWSWAPAEGNGTSDITIFSPAAISFPRTVSVSGYNDITTRWGAAWDVFGNGRTALKINWGKYLQNATNDENYTVNNPASRIVRNVFVRGWIDGNSNFVVDCNLANPDQQITPGGDTCQALAGDNRNFGSPNPNSTVINPDILHGWGVRPADGQFSVSVQHEVLPRVSVDVSYNRRWFENFFVDDNQLVGPADYTRWTYTAPLDSRLPDGGSYPVEIYSITRDAALRGARTYRTFESDFGAERTQYWHGVNLNVSARMRNGLMFQGGTTTGRGVLDRCDTLPKIDSPDPRGCAVTEPFMTAFTGNASYTVPKIDVLVSAQFRSRNPANIGAVGGSSASNGASLSANTQVPNSPTAAGAVPGRTVQDLLGRLPGTALATGTTTVNLLNPGQRYAPDRLNQVDMRFAKIIRFANRRADIAVDLYNVFNTNHTTGYNGNYSYQTNGGDWLRPTTIVAPRFARVNFTLYY
jgi:hypothetical protein